MSELAHQDLSAEELQGDVSDLAPTAQRAKVEKYNTETLRCTRCIQQEGSVKQDMCHTGIAWWGDTPQIQEGQVQIDLCQK